MVTISNWMALRTSVAFKFMIILQNLVTTNHNKESGKNKYDRKLPEFDA